MAGVLGNANPSSKVRHLLRAVDNDLQRLDHLRVSGAPTELKMSLLAARTAVCEAFEPVGIGEEEDVIQATESARFQIAVAVCMARSLDCSTVLQGTGGPTDAAASPAFAPRLHPGEAAGGVSALAFDASGFNRSPLCRLL